jgi:hypothetical protein
MPENPSRGRTPNRILSRLSREDFALLEPHLAPVDLPVRKRLEAPKKRIDQVYFIETGFASVVANGSRHCPVSTAPAAARKRSRRSPNQSRSAATAQMLAGVVSDCGHLPHVMVC